MVAVKCMFCKKTTAIYTINAKKNIDGKVITMRNSPVYYCADCKETYISKETQDAFNYIRNNKLHERVLIFDYEDIAKKIAGK